MMLAVMASAAALVRPLTETPPRRASRRAMAEAAAVAADLVARTLKLPRHSRRRRLNHLRPLARLLSRHLLLTSRQPLLQPLLRLRRVIQRRSPRLMRWPHRRLRARTIPKPQPQRTRRPCAPWVGARVRIGHEGLLITSFEAACAARWPLHPRRAG
jgi:hypothetical protein